MVSCVTLVSKTMGLNGSALDYLLHTQNGNYDAAWPLRIEQLKNCMRLCVSHFTADREVLYLLFVEHVGTNGVGSGIINGYQHTKNGYVCYPCF